MGERGVFHRVRAAGVVAVVTFDSADDAVPVAEALFAGGVGVLELTLRTPAALDALRAVRRKVPDLLVGAGTVLAPAQVKEAIDAGAAFGVAPGTNPRVLGEANRLGLPFGPGVCTPSDIERALEFGCTLLKFFPAEPSGGLPFLQVMAAPYAHLGVSYLPLGGVTEANLAAYLRADAVAAVGGSWLAPAAMIRDRNWDAVRDAARRAVAVRDGVRGPGAGP